MARRDIPASVIPAPVLDICRGLRDRGHRTWIVGGCVRDLLLGGEAKDWDLATSARPDEVQASFRRVIPTGLQHGTVSILLRGVPYEVTTLRGETTYSDGRRPDSVHFVNDIELDLARRDFTVNAIAYDPLTDRLVDPFDGRDDLERKCIRAVGDAATRFNEDGLRVLRAARFVATLEFSLDPTTADAISTALDTFRKVSHERVRDEWMKAMAARRPSRAFEVMRQYGILDVTFPELMELVGCEQNRWHSYDVWTHTMECLDACPSDSVERVAALLHDVGKPRTREFSDKTGDYTFYHHERVGAKMADRWLADYRFSNEERRRIVHLVRHHLVCYSPEWTDAAVRRFVRRIGIDAVGPLLRLARADALAKGRPVDDELSLLEELRMRVEHAIREGSALSTKDLAVDGNDLMGHLGIAPGPQIGNVLRGLLERVLESPELNNRDDLLRLASDMIDSSGNGV